MDHRLVLAPLLMLALSGAARQETEGDWDLTEDPARGLVAASIQFSNGISIGLRCQNGQYDALIAGLPAAEQGAEWQTVSIQVGDEEAREGEWFVANTPGVAISDLPAPLARDLRKGGLVKVRVREAGEQGRRVRYDLDLPASPSQVDRTLSACDKPTTDTRDALVDESDLPAGIVWVRPPEPSYPRGRTFERGFVVTSCLSQPDGRLDDCVVESEFPSGGGFGEEALRATRRSRVGLEGAPGAAMPPRLIIYRSVFRMESVGQAAERAMRQPTRIPTESQP